MDAQDIALPLPLVQLASPTCYPASPPDFGLFQALWVPIWVPIDGLRLMSNRKSVKSQAVASEVASEAPDNRTGTRSCTPRGIELRDARETWRNFARQGYRLPAEPDVIVLEGGQR